MTGMALPSEGHRRCHPECASSGIPGREWRDYITQCHFATGFVDVPDKGFQRQDHHGCGRGWRFGNSQEAVQSPRRAGDAKVLTGPADRDRGT